MFPWTHITLHFCIVLDWIFWTINVLMYCLFSDPSGNCSLRPGRTITFWERWGGGEHLQSSFCYFPWLSEVYKLKVALKCGSGGWDVLHTPKVLSWWAGKFDLHGPQVRTVRISYWILNTAYQIMNHSSFVHCLKIYKFNTFNFHCFTVHFVSQSFTCTNSCTCFKLHQNHLKHFY